MSEENVEIVRKVIDAVNRGDMDAWLGFLSPEVVWESLPLPGFRDTYRGRAEAREWIELLLEVFEEAHHRRAAGWRRGQGVTDVGSWPGANAPRGCKRKRTSGDSEGT